MDRFYELVDAVIPACIKQKNWAQNNIKNPLIDLKRL